jgi:hypothetical protein
MILQHKIVEYDMSNAKLDTQKIFKTQISRAVQERNIARMNEQVFECLAAGITNPFKAMRKKR